MDLQSRKIEFVQDFLKLESEEAICRLEKLLKKEKKNVVGKEIKTMTKKELNKRIDQSEADFKNNRYKKTSQLLSKYK
jgi:ribosomal protein L29